MANYRLPLDLTGTSPANRVTQTRTLNMSSKMGDKFIIPADAPFFAEGMEVYKVGTPTPLVRGVDYELIFEYLDIFQRTQKFVYGGIKFKDRKITGQVRLVLQVLGGPFLQPIQNTLETIARNKTNVNTATWGELAGVPEGFPVLNHPMISDDYTGFGEINTTLNNGISLILAGMGGGSGGGEGAAMVALQNHIQNPTNAHPKSAVGLSNVPNFAMTTYEEADLGVNNKFTSPAIVKYMIAKYSGLEAIASINQQLTKMTRDIQLVQQGLQDNDIKVANLTQTVNGLNNSFTSIRQEFANVLIYVNDLGLSIDNIQASVQEARAQVQDALERVSVMEGTVRQIKLENENINAELLRLNENISGLSDRTEALELTVEDMRVSVKKLNEATLYPLARFVNAGTYNFSIKKGETRVLTLIGPGGAGGIVIPIEEIGLQEPRGTRGGDTYLVLNTDLSNGSKSVGKIVLRAEAGFGGQSSVRSGSGIDFFGRGGPGGKTNYDGLFSVITNANGAGGVDGSGSPGPSHPGAAGQTINGVKFADGGAAPIAAGTGGAGALIKVSVTNSYAFDLEFTAIVGETARNVLGNNYLPAAPGLIIIDLA